MLVVFDPDISFIINDDFWLVNVDNLYIDETAKLEIVFRFDIPA